jgi:predicted nucleotidyltransferase
MARPRTRVRTSPTLRRFAVRLREKIGATRVLLFGSHARGTAQPDSDYDMIIVSPGFEGVHRFDRARGLKDLFYEVGGPAPMDLICLTPEEFDQASRHITLVAAVLPEAIDLLPADTEKTA